MRRVLSTFAALAGLAAPAGATWSIVLIDTRTGEIAVGSATCLTGFDLRAGTPVLIPGVGAATAQSFVDQGGFNRVFIRDRMLEGVDPEDIVTLLAGFDNGHQTRQYGMADVLGGVATFTGTGAGAWAGGVTGRVGDVVYAVQGNVLTGDPVVTEAEQVVITSLSNGLDLAETMMLAMEESRRYGGDGRCSCSNNDPDGCGSPPDGWDYQTGKSAHIAYMLIARAGDGFGCSSVYRVGPVTQGLATGDFNEDGLLDIAAATRSASAVGVLLNSALHPGYVTFATPLLADAPGGPVGVVSADFNRDGRLDLAYADSEGDTVGLLYGRGDGTFQFPALIGAQEGASWIAAGDWNADGWTDAAVTNLTAGTITVLLNDGSGGLDATQHVAAGQAPGVVIAAEIDGSPGPDLACTDQNGAVVTIFSNNGSGSFAHWQTLPTGARPLSVAAGDYDADGRTDLASANRDGRSVQVFRQTAPGVFQPVALGENRQYTAIETLDADGDGVDDIAASGEGPVGLTLLLGRPGADPVLDRGYTLVAGTSDLITGDLDGDGLLDLVSNARSSGSVMAVSGLDPAAGEGYFRTGSGCATAHYYMEFNVAFQSRDDPDPVVQLHDMYDQWRLDLLGVTDAVRTIAELGTDRLPVGSATTLHVEPLDWRQESIGPGLAVSAAHAQGSAGLTTIGDAADNGDGTYTIGVSAATLPPDARGVDAIEVRVVQDGREIVLMPRLTLTLTASIADWNQDGVVDARDVDAFVADWLADEDATDLTDDGVIDTRDVIAFVQAWAGQ